MSGAFCGQAPSWLGASAANCVPGMASQWQRHVPRLSEEPHLAILAALDAALLLAVDALRARHPEVAEWELDDLLDIHLYHAGNIVTLADGLLHVIDQYRATLTRLHADRLARHADRNDF